MPTSTLDISAITSATGWTGATVANLSTQNDVRATGGTAGELILASLSDTPTDFNQVNGDITLSVEARVVGSVSRVKSLLLELLDASNNILGSGSTSTLTSSDATYTVTISGRTDGKAVADGYQLRMTVQEGGGMADSATVEIDRAWVTVVHSSSSGPVTADSAIASWIAPAPSASSSVTVTAAAAIATWSAFDCNVGIPVVDRYLDTASSGGNGSSPALSGASAAYSNWDTAIAAINSEFGSLTSSDVKVRLHCAATNGDPDNLSTNPTSFTSTTDATRYLEVLCEPGYQLVQSNNSWNVMRFSTKKVVLRGVNLLHSGSPSASAIEFGVCAADGWYEVDGGAIICSGTATGFPIRVAGTSNPTIIQRNLVVSGWSRGNCANSGFGGGRVTVVDNCTIVNCGIGVLAARASGDTWIVRNNVCQGNGTDFSTSGSGGTYTTAGNISEDATSPDAGGQSTVVAFEDEVGGDFHLASSGSAADEFGTDLSGDTYGFTTDRDGVTRTAPWSSGAYEAVGAEPLVPNPGIASWTAPAASVAAAVSAAAAAAAANWVLPDVTVAAAVAVTPATAIGSWATPAPVVLIGSTALPAAALASWTVPAVTLSGAVVVTPSAAVASWTAPAPSITATSTAALTSAVASWTTPTPDVTTGGAALAPAAIATWAALAPAVSTAVVVTPSTAIGQWDQPAATVAAVRSVEAAAAASTWSVLAVGISTGGMVTAPAAVSSWTTPAPSVATVAVVTPDTATGLWIAPAPTGAPGVVAVAATPAIASWALPSTTVSAGSFAAFVATCSSGPARGASCSSGATHTATSTSGPARGATRVT